MRKAFYNKIFCPKEKKNHHCFWFKLSKFLFNFLMRDRLPPHFITLNGNLTIAEEGLGVKP